MDAEISRHVSLAFVWITGSMCMTDLDQHEAIQVFVGVDVGKGAHHAVALNRAGKHLLDSALRSIQGRSWQPFW